jgi:hypothetical protein
MQTTVLSFRRTRPLRSEVVRSKYGLEGFRSDLMRTATAGRVYRSVVRRRALKPLDEDVAGKLQAEARRTGLSF